MSDALIEMYDRGFQRDSIVWISVSREHWLKISDRITQLRQELSLAEEGLANYAQEIAALRNDLTACQLERDEISARCVALATQICGEAEDFLAEIERESSSKPQGDDHP